MKEQGDSYRLLWPLLPVILERIMELASAALPAHAGIVHE
jgi:hypothetical protein